MIRYVVERTNCTEVLYRFNPQGYIAALEDKPAKPFARFCSKYRSGDEETKGAALGKVPVRCYIKYGCRYVRFDSPYPCIIAEQAIRLEARLNNLCVVRRKMAPLDPRRVAADESDSGDGSRSKPFRDDGTPNAIPAILMQLY